MVTSISKRGQEQWNDGDNIKFQSLVERCTIDLEKNDRNHISDYAKSTGHTAPFVLLLTSGKRE